MNKSLKRKMDGKRERLEREKRYNERERDKEKT